MRHTRTPWFYERLCKAKGQYGMVAIHPCHFYSESTDVEQDIANAQHIVHCVNTHDELVNALRHVEQNLSEQSKKTFEHELAHIRYALEKAESEG